MAVFNLKPVLQIETSLVFFSWVQCLKPIKRKAHGGVMKSVLRWVHALLAAALCLLLFQSCAGGGALDLEGSSVLGPFGHGATPPASAFAELSQTSSVCPAGTQAIVGSGYLSMLCVKTYSASSTELIVDVRLMSAGAGCASGYIQVANFTSGNQVLCARTMPVKNAVQVVTGLYETSSSGGCMVGDALSGSEDASTLLCEKF
jgi:hypothetical protein